MGISKSLLVAPFFALSACSNADENPSPDCKFLPTCSDLLDLSNALQEGHDCLEDKFTTVEDYGRADESSPWREYGFACDNPHDLRVDVRFYGEDPYLKGRIAVYPEEDKLDWFWENSNANRLSLWSSSVDAPEDLYLHACEDGMIFAVAKYEKGNGMTATFDREDCALPVPSFPGYTLEVKDCSEESEKFLNLRDELLAIAADMAGF